MLYILKYTDITNETIIIFLSNCVSQQTIHNAVHILLSGIQEENVLCSNDKELDSNSYSCASLIKWPTNIFYRVYKSAHISLA